MVYPADVRPYIEDYDEWNIQNLIVWGENMMPSDWPHDRDIDVAFEDGLEGCGNGIASGAGKRVIQGRMGYLSFRRFRLWAMGTDGFAVMRCVAVTGERMIFAVLSFMLSVVFPSKESSLQN